MAKKNIDLTSYILNKKFSKDFGAGYNANEVDEFFDEVIEYVKKKNSDIELLTKQINSLQQECNLRTKEIEYYKEKVNALSVNLEKLNSDGYANQRIISEISKLQQDIHNIKTNKNG